MDIYKDLQKDVVKRDNLYDEYTMMQENLSTLDGKINVDALKTTQDKALKTIDEVFVKMRKAVLENAKKKGIKEADIKKINKQIDATEKARTEYIKTLLEGQMIYLIDVFFDDLNQQAYCSFLDLTFSQNTDSFYNRVDSSMIIQYDIVNGIERRFTCMPNFMLVMAKLYLQDKKETKNLLDNISNQEQDVKDLSKSNIMLAMLESGYDILFAKHMENNGINHDKVAFYKINTFKDKDKKIDSRITSVEISQMLITRFTKDKLELSGMDYYAFNYQFAESLYNLVKTVDVFYSDKSFIEALTKYQTESKAEKETK